MKWVWGIHLHTCSYIIEDNNDNKQPRIVEFLKLLNLFIYVEFITIIYGVLPSLRLWGKGKLNECNSLTNQVGNVDVLWRSIPL